MPLPYLPLYVDDFEAATAHLTIEEDGVYNRLLRLCWRTPGCSIPDDDQWIMRRMRVSQADFDRVVKPIIGEFFTRAKGRIFQKRQVEEYEKAMTSHTKRKEAGKKGGLAKSLKEKDSDPSNALATRTRTRTNKPPTPLKGEGDELDEDEKGKKKEAREAKKQRDRKEIIDALTSVVSDDVADNFFEHRREIKKPLTLRGAQLIIKKLEGNRLADQILNESIANGWQGVFPEKLQPRSQSAQPRSRIRKSYGLSAIGINEGGEE